MSIIPERIVLFTNLASRSKPSSPQLFNVTCGEDISTARSLGGTQALHSSTTHIGESGGRVSSWEGGGRGEGIVIVHLYLKFGCRWVEMEEPTL